MCHFAPRGNGSYTGANWPSDCTPRTEDNYHSGMQLFSASLTGKHGTNRKHGREYRTLYIMVSIKIYLFFYLPFTLTVIVYMLHSTLGAEQVSVASSRRRLHGIRAFLLWGPTGFTAEEDWTEFSRPKYSVCWIRWYSGYLRLPGVATVG